jgi:hypothetical protein
MTVQTCSGCRQYELIVHQAGTAPANATAKVEYCQAEYNRMVLVLRGYVGAISDSEQATDVRIGSANPYRRW